MHFPDSVEDKKYPYINPVIFGFENCEPSHHFGPAVRTYWLIHYVESGSGVFKIGNSVYKLHSGDMFVIPPYVETYYEADEVSPWEYVWVGFTCSGELPIKLDDVIHSTAARKVFSDMKQSFSKDNGKTEFLCAKIWELFSVLMEENNNSQNHVQKALNLIHTEYVNGISVKEIADRLNLDRTYLSVIFKDAVGVSPAGYLMKYRMERAADLMINNNTKISITAFSVGYTDIYTFSKSFKKYFGVSPREYIKKHPNG